MLSLIQPFRTAACCHKVAYYEGSPLKSTVISQVNCNNVNMEFWEFSSKSWGFRGRYSKNAAGQGKLLNFADVNRFGPGV